MCKNQERNVYYLGGISLWGYMMNQIITEEQKINCEIAWFPDNQYNDFSCIKSKLPV